MILNKIQPSSQIATIFPIHKFLFSFTDLLIISLSLLEWRLVINKIQDKQQDLLWWDFSKKGNDFWLV